jgi:hypothetical protein
MGIVMDGTGTVCYYFKVSPCLRRNSVISGLPFQAECIKGVIPCESSSSTLTPSTYIITVTAMSKRSAWILVQMRFCPSLLPLLRIRDIFVRIRILGSIPLTIKGFSSGCGFCYFRQWPSRWQIKSIFANYFLKQNLHNFSKIKSHTEVTKQ